MLEIKPPYILSEHYSQDTLNLLERITLGSNGARYRHIGIPNRIDKLESPIFLSLQLRTRTIGNITFCRRQKDWYVRYFAFDPIFQSSVNKGKKSGQGKIKRQLHDFFQHALKEPDGPKCFYAYIDPKNERSLWMSESFNFKTIASIATQTYSRIKPRQQSVEKVTDLEWIKNQVERKFGMRTFYHPHQTFNSTPFYQLIKDGETLAFAKIHYATWKIERLPGKRGKLLTKVIPFIPIINQLIKPNKHTFLAVDSVWVKNNDSRLLNQLFEGILFAEKHRIIHWWVDHNDPLYQTNKNELKWGLIHQINGVHSVNLVSLSNEKIDLQNEPAFVSGFDFV